MYYFINLWYFFGFMPSIPRTNMIIKTNFLPCLPLSKVLRDVTFCCFLNLTKMKPNYFDWALKSKSWCSDDISLVFFGCG